MNIIRKIVIGKDYTKDAMSYAVGQKVYRGQYIINSIIKDEYGKVDIYIENEGEIMSWKHINEHIPYVLEYSLDFV